MPVTARRGVKIMAKFTRWLRSLLSDAVSRTIATLLAGALVPVVIALISIGASRFLLQAVTVPLALLLILALFAFVGLVAAAVPLWHLVGSRSRQLKSPVPSDERLEQANSILLARLAEIESGKQIYVEAEVRDYRASTLALFDQWEASVAPYLPAAELDAIGTLRAEITGRSLQHSAHEAHQWVLKVKDQTNKAREKLIRQAR
jgi:hypothetical protein